MWNSIYQHGDKFTQKFKVGQNTLYTKPMQYCEKHGKIDLVLFPDFDGKHGQCGEQSQPEETAKLAKAVAAFNKKISLKIDVRVYAKTAVNKFRAAREIL